MGKIYRLLRDTMSDVGFNVMDIIFGMEEKQDDYIRKLEARNKELEDKEDKEDNPKTDK